MDKKYKILILGLTVLAMPLMARFWSLPLAIILFLILGSVLVRKKFLVWFWLLPILFLLTLYVNNFFSIFSFDWEKMVIGNKNFLYAIERLKNEGLWIPFTLRNILYSNWLLVFSWLNLIFKLLSPMFLIRALGYGGFFFFAYGIIDYLNDKTKKWWPVIWGATVVFASGLGVLVDSGNAIVLALPSIIYFLILGINTAKFKKYWKIWILLFVIDLILK
jgi:hypothetical protein